MNDVGGEMRVEGWRLNKSYNLHVISMYEQGTYKGGSSVAS